MGIVETIKDLFLGSFSMRNKKGEMYWLHKKIGRGGTVLYYFSKSSTDAINLPSGFKVVEGEKGLPTLKKMR